MVVPCQYCYGSDLRSTQTAGLNRTARICGRGYNRYFAAYNKLGTWYKLSNGYYAIALKMAESKLCCYQGCCGHVLMLGMLSGAAAYAHRSGALANVLK